MNSKIPILIKKELGLYFNSPLGYIVAGVFLISSGWIFMQSFFLYEESSMRSFFNLMPIILIFILPAITMSSWAEEKKSGTVEVMLTLPIESYQVAIAKFLSALIFLVIMLLLTLPIPFMINEIGSPDRGIILAGYLGSIFLGSAYIAIGLWVSSQTKNQIIAFLISVVIIFIFYIVGSSFILDSLPNSISFLGKNLSFSTHFDSILRGVLSLKDLVYYISIVAFFLFMNAKSVSERNWK